MPYALLILALILNTSLAIVDKQSSVELHGNRQIMFFSFYKTMLCAVFAGIILIFKDHEFSYQAAIISLGAGLAHALSVVLIMKALKNASAVFVNLTMSAGVIFPCVTGWVFFSVTVTATKIIFLILLIVALSFVLGAQKENFCGLQYLFPMFLCYGMLMVMQNIFPKLCPGQSTAMFSAVMYGSSTIILGIVSIAGAKGKLKLSKKLIMLGGLAGLGNLSINLLLTGLSAVLAASAVFPTVHGLKLVAITLLSPVMWRERLSAKQIIGCFAAIICVCLISV